MCVKCQKLTAELLDVERRLAHQEAAKDLHTDAGKRATQSRNWLKAAQAKLAGQLAAAEASHGQP